MNKSQSITRGLLALITILAFFGLTACQQGHDKSATNVTSKHHKKEAGSTKHIDRTARKQLQAHIHDHDGDKIAASKHAQNHEGDYAKAHTHDHNGEEAAAAAHTTHH